MRTTALLLALMLPVAPSARAGAESKLLNPTKDARPEQLVRLRTRPPGPAGGGRENNPDRQNRRPFKGNHLTAIGVELLAAL